jgi:hypothetical protein
VKDPPSQTCQSHDAAAAFKRTMPAFNSQDETEWLRLLVIFIVRNQRDRKFSLKHGMA